MLNKKTDFALVGHNFFSYLVGIGLLARKKKVLILDDDRFNFGDLFTDSLTILDLEILKKWGEKYDVPPLKKLEEYIQFSPISFFIGKKEILLGDNPSRNYTELARKLPFFFSSKDITENFDQGIYQVANSLADAFYTDRNLLKLPKRLLDFKNLEVMKKFDDFFSLFFQKDKWEFELQSELNSFVALGRGYFHNRLSINGSRSELMHLFFSLLSPRFKFDHERLVSDLLAHYQSAGGEFKKLNIRALKFQRGMVANFELESYEGLIAPSHLLLIGGEPVGLPILLKEKMIAYNAMEVKLSLKNPLPAFLINKKILFTSPMKTGTSWPFWEASFFSDSISFNLVMLKRQGIKVEFVADQVINYLLEDLAFLYPGHEFVVSSSQLKFTLDVLIEDNNTHAHLRETTQNRFRPIKVYSKVSPFSFFRLKNVSYLGPYCGNTHGVVSSLLQMQRQMESL
jgi:hypothetical protein